MQGETIPGVESRYALFGLDAGARDEVKKVWPIIMPRVEQALDLMLQAAAHQPNISQTIKEHTHCIACERQRQMGNHSGCPLRLCGCAACSV